MDKIAIKGMQFRAFHGYYAEEHTIGNDYEVDVIIQAELAQRKIDDDLSKTYDYEQIYEICARQMKQSQNLVETVAENVLAEIVEHSPFSAHFTVVIRKLRPQVGGPVECAEITMQRSR